MATTHDDVYKALANTWKGFCHLHLIIAALENVRLGAVTNSTKGSFYNSTESESNRKHSSQSVHRSFKQEHQVRMRTSSLQSLHGLLVDLAHGMVNSCTRQRETHLFTKSSVPWPTNNPIQQSQCSTDSNTQSLKKDTKTIGWCGEVRWINCMRCQNYSDRNDNTEFILMCQNAQCVAHSYLLDYLWMIPPPIMPCIIKFQLKMYSQT